RFSTFEDQGDPVFFITNRIFEKSIAINIAFESASQNMKNILVAVIVKISEAYGMAFLDVTESAGGCDILEGFPLIVSVHFIGNNRGKARRTSADVEIGESIVVEVAEITSHSEHRFGKPHFF